MIVDEDPVVARVLELLVPPQGGDAEELLSRARVKAEERRSSRCRRRRVAGLAFAVLALLTGAAIASSRFDLLPFLRTHDRASVRFSVDPTRTYRGDSPATLACASAGTGEFACTSTAGGRGARRYVLVTHAEASPELTRAGMLARLAVAEQQGESRAVVRRVRADVAAVSDEFISSLNLLVSIQTIATSQSVPGHPGLELVPPARVPIWVECASRTARTFGCRNLAASTSVPVGTPIYRLRPGRDWHRVTGRQTQPLAIDRLLDTVLGRQPTEAEISLLLDLVSAVPRP